MTQAPNILLTRSSPESSSFSGASSASSSTNTATTTATTIEPQNTTGENGSLSSRSGSGKRSATAANSQRTQCYRTKLCKFFDQGVCDRGESCTYAHSEEQLRQAPNLRKTKLCNQWQHNKCPHLSAANCPYAHGPNDLRVFDRKDSLVDDENSRSTSGSASASQDLSDDSQGINATNIASEPQGLSSLVSCGGKSSTSEGSFSCSAPPAASCEIIAGAEAAGEGELGTGTNLSALRTAEMNTNTNTNTNTTAAITTATTVPSHAAQNTPSSQSIGPKYTNERMSAGVWRSNKTISEYKDVHDSSILGANNSHSHTQSSSNNLKSGGSGGGRVVVVANATNATTNEMSAGSTKSGLLTYPYNKPNSHINTSKISSSTNTTSSSCCSNADDYYHHQRCLNSGDARHINSTIFSRWYAANGTNRSTTMASSNTLYGGGGLMGSSSTATTSTTSNSEDGHDHFEERGTTTTSIAPGLSSGISSGISSNGPDTEFPNYLDKAERPEISNGPAIIDEYTTSAAAYSWKADWDFSTIINASTYRLTFTAGIIHRYDD